MSKTLLLDVYISSNAMNIYRAYFIIYQIPVSSNFFRWQDFWGVPTISFLNSSWYMWKVLRM